MTTSQFLVRSSVVLATVVAMTIAPAALAATMTFAPVTLTAQVGVPQSVVITLDPEAVKSYTAKLQLSFPANLITVQSFTFSSGWMALSQPGYDSIDNGAGTLIKTAGYPGGVTSPKIFGTLTFVAKQSGSGTIAVTPGSSFVLGVNNQSSPLSGSVAINVTGAAAIITTPASTQSGQTVSAVAPVALAQPTGTPVETTQTTPTEEVTLPQTAQASDANGGFVATAGNIITLGTGNAIVGVIVALLVLGIAYYAFSRRSKDNQKKN